LDFCTINVVCSGWIENTCKILFKKNIINEDTNDKILSLTEEKIWTKLIYSVTLGTTKSEI
jgi:hypothetical protein